AEPLISRTNAVYKGITLTTNANGPVLLAANFREGTLDMYDTNLNLVFQFSDPSAPAGFAPFNVQTREGMVFVTFALQDTNREDDVAGPGNGLIDTFDPLNGIFHRFASGSNAGGQIPQINSPWGVVVTPTGFAGRASELLVGNFGSGTIMRFDVTGQFLGVLLGTNGRPLVIDGLWALTFGNGGQAGLPGSLFFSAGPAEEKHGLFGRLEPVVVRGNGIPR
ncbi:MAG TPA: TIGR03118 family protein, partial [Bacillota bacterium]|nr:TIGR03118 family protein [Bacillota bacterium]